MAVCPVTKSARIQKAANTQKEQQNNVGDGGGDDDDDEDGGYEDDHDDSNNGDEYFVRSVSVYTLVCRSLTPRPYASAYPHSFYSCGVETRLIICILTF
jgi:hypothetical protein